MAKKTSPIIVDETAVDQRLDRFLVVKTGQTRSQIQKQIKAGTVTVNGATAAVHRFLKEGDKIKISNQKSVISNEEKQTAPSSLPITHYSYSLIAATPDYLIIDKPAGLVVHPDSKYRGDTLIEQITRRYPAIKKIGDDPDRPGVVHRLDRDVSGVMIIARTAKMFDHLKRQFAERLMKKEYIALVIGRLTPDQGTVTFPISRSIDRTKMAAHAGNHDGGQMAITDYEVTHYYPNATLLTVWPKTGRTHQIRVHLKALGHPIVGDTLYTIKKQKPPRHPLDRVWLHAHRLGFTDRAGQWQEYVSPLPTVLTDYLKKLN